MPIISSKASMSAQAYGLFGVTAAPFGPVGAYDALATVTVPSGGASSITFSALPQTGYSHLQVRYMAQDNRPSYAADDIQIYFNGDTTTSHYQSHRLYGFGNGSANADAPNGLSGVLAGYVYSSNGGLGSAFGAGVTDILDYTSTTKNKITRTISGTDNNGGSGVNSGQVGITSGLWNTTPVAINSLTIIPGNGTAFNQYSQFSLYGIK